MTRCRPRPLLPTRTVVARHQRGEVETRTVTTAELAGYLRQLAREGAWVAGVGGGRVSRLTIILARVEVDIEIVRVRRTDLGERPITREVPLPPTAAALLATLRAAGGRIPYRDPQVSTAGLTALRRRGLATVETAPGQPAVVVLTQTQEEL